MAQTQQGGRPKQSALPESGLIRSKLSPGRLPNGIVPRPTLLERLSAGHQRALTLVSAPAGFGKTTLISEWASGSASVAWVSLDKGDTDPARFWGHVIAALATTEPHVGTTSLAAVKARPEEVEKYGLPLKQSSTSFYATVPIWRSSWMTITSPRPDSSTAASRPSCTIGRRASSW